MEIEDIWSYLNWDLKLSFLCVSGKKQWKQNITKKLKFFVLFFAVFTLQ